MCVNQVGSSTELTINNKNMDPIGNMLTSIRNAQAVRKESVTLPYSRVKEAILNILKSEGFISGISMKTRKGGKVIDVTLRYDESGSAVISGIKRLSKPSRRTYSSRDKLYIYRKKGTAVVSTPGGMMTAKNAAKSGYGGELVCLVW